MEICGKGTNNKAKGLALRELLKLVLVENIKDFNGCGDSELWVEFMEREKMI